jgi:cytoplasmic tRNA 2-thiolation protein 1
MVVRPKDGSRVCKPCFLDLFEAGVHETILSSGMFRRGDRVGVGISGGKDSTVLAYVLDLLNKRHSYGIELLLLSVDEGIEGYRDRSIETVRQNREELGLRLRLVSFKELFGVTMDDVVKRVGRRQNCTYCGVFRRQALEDAARKAGADLIVTGHNADDIAETVLLNMLRGDVSRLARCTLTKTHSQSGDGGTILSLTRAKPFKYTYQKEIVLYAFYRKLRYFSTECTYSPGAYRGDVRMLIKELEKADPRIVLNIIRSGDGMQSSEESRDCTSPCIRCSHPTSSGDRVCNGCTLVSKLNGSPPHR